MGNVSLRDWLALLREAGVSFTGGAGVRTAVEAAANRLNVSLDSQDRQTLSGLEEHLTSGAQRDRTASTQTEGHVPLVDDDPFFSRRQTEGHVPLVDDTRFSSRPIQQAMRAAVQEGAAVAAAPPALMAQLPPWGFMEEALQAQTGQSIVPIDWTANDGSQGNLDKWKEFRARLVQDIDSMLWPVYRPGGASWSTPEVAQLLEADFKLLQQIHDNLGRPVNALFPTRFRHGDFFKDEDDGSIPIGTGYDRYDPSLAPPLVSGLPTVLIGGIIRKVGTLDLQLKQQFQRPRPHQVAFIQGRNDFQYRWARTGNTPSLVSGHCLQLCIGGCSAYIAYEKHLNASSIEVLKQYTVDVGDRRVFAGIHFPSDSLSSWYVALCLLPTVFLPEHVVDVRRFLWSAISTKSALYAAISAYRDPQGNTPYKRILDEISRLGSTDG